VPEITVDPAALVAVARPLVAVGDRLGALSGAVKPVFGQVGPDELSDALEDFAHRWRLGLRTLAGAAALAGEQLSGAGSTYDGVEVLVRGWSHG
jgi:hypothetical protein